jgi:hypothetical protein
MPRYVISVLYGQRGTSEGTDFAQYEAENASLKQAKQEAKVFAQEERERCKCQVRIVRVESQAAAIRRSAREGF